VVSAELLQFYTVRDRLLYEVVVIFTIEKNKVTGYLSTTKSAAPSIAKWWLRVPLYGHCPTHGGHSLRGKNAKEAAKRVLQADQLGEQPVGMRG
jgi:hypothetical protein